MEFFIYLFVSLVITALLTPKPKPVALTQDAEQPTLRYASSVENTLVLGRTVIKQPVVLWYGDQKIVAQFDQQSQKRFLQSSKTITNFSHFEYFLGGHYGLASVPNIDDCSVTNVYYEESSSSDSTRKLFRRGEEAWVLTGPVGSNRDNFFRTNVKVVRTSENLPGADGAAISALNTISRLEAAFNSGNSSGSIARLLPNTGPGYKNFVSLYITCPTDKAFRFSRNQVYKSKQKKVQLKSGQILTQEEYDALVNGPIEDPAAPPGIIGNRKFRNNAGSQINLEISKLIFEETSIFYRFGGEVSEFTSALTDTSSLNLSLINEGLFSKVRNGAGGFVDHVADYIGPLDIARNGSTNQFTQFSKENYRFNTAFVNRADFEVNRNFPPFSIGRAYDIENADGSKEFFADLGITLNNEYYQVTGFVGKQNFLPVVYGEIKAGPPEFKLKSYNDLYYSKLKQEITAEGDWSPGLMTLVLLLQVIPERFIDIPSFLGKQTDIYLSGTFSGDLLNAIEEVLKIGISALALDTSSAKIKYIDLKSNNDSAVFDITEENTIEILEAKRTEATANSVEVEFTDRAQNYTQNVVYVESEQSNQLGEPLVQKEKSSFIKREEYARKYAKDLLDTALLSKTSATVKCRLSSKPKITDIVYFTSQAYAIENMRMRVLKVTFDRVRRVYTLDLIEDLSNRIRNLTPSVQEEVQQTKKTDNITVRVFAPPLAYYTREELLLKENMLVAFAEGNEVIDDNTETDVVSFDKSFVYSSFSDKVTRITSEPNLVFAISSKEVEIIPAAIAQKYRISDDFYTVLIGPKELGSFETVVNPNTGENIFQIRRAFASRRPFTRYIVDGSFGNSNTNDPNFAFPNELATLSNVAFIDPTDNNRSTILENNFVKFDSINNRDVFSLPFAGSESDLDSNTTSDSKDFDYLTIYNDINRYSKFIFAQTPNNSAYVSPFHLSLGGFESFRGLVNGTFLASNRANIRLNGFYSPFSLGFEGISSNYLQGESFEISYDSNLIEEPGIAYYMPEADPTNLVITSARREDDTIKSWFSPVEDPGVIQRTFFRVFAIEGEFTGQHVIDFDKVQLVETTGSSFSISLPQLTGRNINEFTTGMPVTNVIIQTVSVRENIDRGLTPFEFAASEMKYAHPTLMAAQSDLLEKEGHPMGSLQLIWWDVSTTTDNTLFTQSRMNYIYKLFDSAGGYIKDVMITEILSNSLAGFSEFQEFLYPIYIDDAGIATPQPIQIEGEL